MNALSLCLSLSLSLSLPLFLSRFLSLYDLLTDLLPCRIPVHRLGGFGSFLYPRREFSPLFLVSCKFGDFDQIVGWLESKMAYKLCYSSHGGGASLICMSLEDISFVRTPQTSTELLFALILDQWQRLKAGISVMTPGNQRKHNCRLFQLFITWQFWKG